MRLETSTLIAGLDAIAHRHKRVASELKRIGYPKLRKKSMGYKTLLRTIIGQQVSVAAANAIWRNLEKEIGNDFTPTSLMTTDSSNLQACGISRQKQKYVRSLCQRIAMGALNLDSLPEDDEEAIDLLTSVNGIGRWSAEIYLLFAEGRPDIWPAGDLVIRKGLKWMFDLPEHPSEQATRAIAKDWSPHRSAMAIFIWYYHDKSAL